MHIKKVVNVLIYLYNLYHRLSNPQVVCLIYANTESTKLVKVGHMTSKNIPIKVSD